MSEEEKKEDGGSDAEGEAERKGKEATEVRGRGQRW